MGARGRAVLLSDGGSLSLTAEDPGLECKAFFTLVIGAEHLRIHEHLPSIGAKWYVSMSMRYVQFKGISLWIVAQHSNFIWSMAFQYYSQTPPSPVGSSFLPLHCKLCRNSISGGDFRHFR